MEKSAQDSINLIPKSDNGSENIPQTMESIISTAMTTNTSRNSASTHNRASVQNAVQMVM